MRFKKLQPVEVNVISVVHDFSFFVRYDLATDVSYETATRQDFPSVTVCNLNPIQRGKIPEGGSLEKLLHKYENLDDTQDGPEFTDLNLKLLFNLKVRYAANGFIRLYISFSLFHAF